jgi:hypothetical protein
LELPEYVKNLKGWASFIHENVEPDKRYVWYLSVSVSFIHHNGKPIHFHISNRSFLSCSSRTKLAHGFIVESPRAFVPNGATLGRLASTRQCPPKGHHNLKGRSVPARETKLSLHTGLLQETLSVPISSSTVESSLALSALPTFDPTTALSDVLGTVLNTPLILAIPIVAALLVATLIAYLIVAYAQPAEDE